MVDRNYFVGQALSINAEIMPFVFKKYHPILGMVQHFTLAIITRRNCKLFLLRKGKFLVILFCVIDNVS